MSKIKEKINESIIEVMTDANYISGRQVSDLEEKLASYVGVKHCITCANGTDALTLALMNWHIGKGDAVFVPNFTFFASGETVAYEGATPIFVDVEETKDNYAIPSAFVKYTEYLNMTIGKDAIMKSMDK